jgi:hypothetical protein
MRAGDEVKCEICAAQHPLKNMREHVGRHVIELFRAPERINPEAHNKLSDHVSNKFSQGSCRLTRVQMGTNPCGFCGRNIDRSGGCIVDLSQAKTGKPSVRSACKYQHLLTARKYDDKMKRIQRNMCTNLPMHCPFCPKGINGVSYTVWSYNFIVHLWEKHSKDNNIPDLDPNTWLCAFISKDEEKFMGMTANDTETWRELHGVPDSEGLDQVYEDKDEDEPEEHKEEEHALIAQKQGVCGDKRRRSRAFTGTSTASTAPKPQKRRA